MGVTHLRSLKGLKDLPVIWEKELLKHLLNAIRHAPASMALPAPLGSRSRCQQRQARTPSQPGEDTLTF